MPTRTLALLLPLALVSWLACQSSSATVGAPAPRGPAGADSPEEELALGGRLYGDHCAVCHGESGAGDGPASPYLFPPARDFTRARFRLVSTENGVPSGTDLVRTLRRGIPGSAMPAWDWLEAEELDALASFVHFLAQRGLARDMHLSGSDQEQALSAAAAAFTPGERLPSVVAVEDSGATLSRGQQVYGTHCAACHGDDGRGGPPRFDEDGSLNWPRDFTAGYLKGGRSAEALGWRIQAGLPGTAMPATSLPAQDLEALVAWVRHMVPEQAEANRVHRRGTIRAPRLAALPTSAMTPEWDRCKELEVVLAPLDASLSAEGVTAARIAAVHDGSHVALRVRWRDPSANIRFLSDLAGPDACALQLSSDERPRFFGMGDAAHTTNVWHWKALRASELSGALDLLDPPHARIDTFEGEVRADVPLYHPQWTLPGASEDADSLRAGGVGTLAMAESDGPVAARPEYVEGEWFLVFTRACAPSGPGEVALQPGGAVNVALAVWNGSAGDRGARKSISIWQRLALAP